MVLGLEMLVTGDEHSIRLVELKSCSWHEAPNLTPNEIIFTETLVGGSGGGLHHIAKDTNY